MPSYSDTDPASVRSPGGIRVVGASFVRPTGTTAYGINDLVGINTSVNAGNAISVPNAVLKNGDAFRIEAVRVYKTSVTGLIGFRVWLWNAQPTFTVGDNGVFGDLTGLATANVDMLVDKIDVTLTMSGSANATGRGVPALGNAVSIKPTTGLGFYYSLTVLAGYTPVSAETFNVLFEGVGS
jgi:hypothetical protein